MLGVNEDKKNKKVVKKDNKVRDISWARKYRPKTMNDYIGNDKTKTKISKALSVNKLPQTILLVGTRGTGKTTLARLLTKSLMCENPVDGVACNECKTCHLLDDKFIMNGGKVKDLAIEEYDIGSAGKIEKAREIVSRMKSSTLSNRKKVYILDEIQKASPDAQQVFLKEIEEPKPNTYIIFCTTDPQDLLPALKSRLTSFNILKPSAKDIAERLAYICKKEGVDYSMEALTLLANKTDRVPRESLMRAEFIATSEPLNLKAVQENLMVVSEDIYLDYLTTVKNGKLYEVLGLSSKLHKDEDNAINLEIGEFSNGLGNFIVSLINIKANVKLGEYDKTTLKRLRRFSKEFTDEQLVEMLKIIKNYGTIKNNDSEYLLYTMTVELFEIFELSRKEEMNIPEGIANTRYREVSDKMKNNGVAKPDEEVDLDSIDKIFKGSQEVSLETLFDEVVDDVKEEN